MDCTDASKNGSTFLFLLFYIPIDIFLDEILSGLPMICKKRAIHFL
jgi:hypothetical protein